MPRNSEDAIRRRYEEAIRTARVWMDEEGRSQAFLARELGVDRSVLTRFLTQEAEVYTPSPSRPRIMKILEGIEGICKPRPRDIFLSHRSKDKDFVKRLASDIESWERNGKRILTWLDEAEIRPGQSIPGSISRGLDTSRYIGIIMTPSYFDQQSSGWTDAEWHAAMHADPDNRQVKLIPILAADCPYIPALLRHLMVIDLRGNKYDQGLEQLARILRDEPLPRPVTYRGELISSSGYTDRAGLVAERMIPEADPDPVAEKAYCNLLPIERLPRHIYCAQINAKTLKAKAGSKRSQPTKKVLIAAIRKAQEDAGEREPRTPAFRIDGDSIVTFHDLESPESLISPVIEADSVECFDTQDFLGDEDDRKIVVSLINMAIARHMHGKGLEIDSTRFNRFFFPPQGTKERVVEWIPVKKKSKRTVAKPFITDGKTTGWMHHACSLKAIYLASQLYIQIVPTRLLTEDGHQVRGGQGVGRIVNRWLALERNLHILYHVRFWTMMLRRGPGPISIRVGDQWMEAATVPAFIQQSYGIRHDQRDLMGLLDEEAPLIAQLEEEAESDELSETEDAGEPEDLDDADEASEGWVNGEEYEEA